MNIVDRNGMPLQPSQPPAPTITVGVNYEQELMVLTAEGFMMTAKGPAKLQVQVPLSFEKARAFADAIQVAMIPPKADELTLTTDPEGSNGRGETIPTDTELNGETDDG